MLAVDVGLFLSGVAVGAVVFVLCALPFVAPWRMRLRWLLAAQTPDPFTGFAYAPRLVMREVTIEDVCVNDDVIDVCVADAQSGRRVVLRRDTRDEIVQLKRWCALELPLLLVLCDDDTAQLGGPDATVSGLHAVRQIA